MKEKKVKNNWKERRKKGKNITDSYNRKYKEKAIPVKGYCSVNVPSGLYHKVKGCIDLGYRSVSDFVLEAVRVRLVDLGETAPVRCVP